MLLTCRNCHQAKLIEQPIAERQYVNGNVHIQVFDMASQTIIQEMRVQNKVPR